MWPLISCKIVKMKKSLPDVTRVYACSFSSHSDPVETYVMSIVVGLIDSPFPPAGLGSKPRFT